jgi:hypothetical protein
MRCKWTVLFAAARFFILPVTTNRLNNPPSGKRNVSEWTSYAILQFSTWMERLSTAIRLRSSFNRRRLRYFFFPTICHYFTEDDNFDIVSTSVLIPCARELIIQYFQFHSVVHFNMFKCAEQSAHSACLPRSGLTKLIQLLRSGTVHWLEDV